MFENHVFCGEKGIFFQTFSFKKYKKKSLIKLKKKGYSFSSLAGVLKGKTYKFNLFLSTKLNQQIKFTEPTLCGWIPWLRTQVLKHLKMPTICFWNTSNEKSE